MNNKPTIIDDVNVAGCEYIEHSHLCKKFKEYAICKITDIGAVTACIEKHNCYYKQLQHAKKEIEFWKHNFEEMKKNFKNMDETATQAIQEKWQLTEENKRLTEDLTALQQTYAACEKEYNALAKRYHELQGVLYANEKRI